jgi:hypothetical protein
VPNAVITGDRAIAFRSLWSGFHGQGSVRADGS